MVLKAVLLDNDERFIKFLDPDLIRLDETREQYNLSTISTTYKIDDPILAKKLFKVGHKIWVNGDTNLRDCLYVINESLKNDFFSENEVEFEAEDVLSELNYIPFTHTSITSSKGFSIDGKGAVTVDRTALELWFGNHFDIGVMQPCLTPYLQKISPIGTMTLMELLRLIEDETSNVFSTRYEKDKNNNVIHRYLDFLNPKSKTDEWNLSFEYHVPQQYTPEESTTNLNEDYDQPVSTISDGSNDDGEDDIVFDKDDFEIIDVTNFVLNIIENNEILISKTALEVGLNGRSEEYHIDLNYSENENHEGNLNINVIGYSYDEILASNPNSETYMSETDNNPSINIPITLGRNITIQLVDGENNKIIHEQTIDPIINDTIGDVLDLGYNVDNIIFETDESDTFKAVAPILSLSDESGTNSLNKTDLECIITNWLNLSIEKGQIVPMIVERVSLNQSQKNSLGTCNLENNYFTRPLKPNDSVSGEDSTWEYFKASAYWKAPFSKLQGELYVADDEDTGVEYDYINGKSNVHQDSMEHRTPKLCTVETSDEDVYAIFNAICMKLKDKRFPDLNIEVDVKNFRKNMNNNYNIFDKVYVKLPTCGELIVASVNKTIKNAYDVGENKIELSNYSNTIKVSPARTMIDGKGVSFTYPNNVEWNVSLVNLESQVETSNKLLTFTLYKLDENNTENIVTSYNIFTDDDGKASLTLSYEPADYQMKVNFGGDAELSSSGATFPINVNGSITKNNPGQLTSASKKKKTKTKTKKSYYSKYGVSPDEKSILAIGKASTSSEKKKYGTKHLWEVKLKRKCHCGSTKLFWGYEWGSKFRNKKESGSKEGRIICDKCGASYSIFGEGGKHDLTRIEAPKKSSKTNANKLKNGKFVYDQWKVTVKPKKVSGNNGGVINRSSNVKTQSGLVKNDVKKEALNIVKDKTGIKAVKALANWISKNIKTESREGFYQSPSTTLHRKKGNDCCKTDLLMHMLDAAGVIKSGIGCYYVHTHKKTKKKGIERHVFAKINGKWVDVVKKHPWGHYKTGYGAVTKAEIKRYPYLPFQRKY